MRFAPTLAAAALAAAGLTFIPSSAHAAGYDPAGLDAGIAWLDGRLTDGALTTSYGPDYSTTGYFAIALQRLGGHSAELDTLVDALESHPAEQIGGYVGSADVYAGSAAKLAVIAQAAGDDPTNLGGVDVIETVEGQVGVDGRTFDTSDYGDYANTIGQAYAAEALSTAGSSKAGAVTEFLLDQQCSDGWFRLNFSAKAAADQTCDGDPSSKPDPDATSFFLLELKDLALTEPAVARAVGRAESWLLDQQRADGSFGGGVSTEGSNANSTGLAGWALGELDHDKAAERAATWVRTMQAHELAACPTALSGETGAIAYDAKTLASGRKAGVTDAYMWQLAAAQALPVLQWLPVTTGSPKLAAPTGFQAGGTSVAYRVTGAAPAQTLCLTSGVNKHAATTSTDGSAEIQDTLPAATTEMSVSLASATGVVAATTVRVLGPTSLTATASKKVKRGKRISVTVRGLAAGEQVTLKLGTATLGRATASAAGDAVLRAKVAKRTAPGKKAITVTGAFANRSGKASVKVTR